MRRITIILAILFLAGPLHAADSKTSELTDLNGTADNTYLLYLMKGDGASDGYLTAANLFGLLDSDLLLWDDITPGTGVGTALAVNVGSAGAFVTNGGALGTPASGTLTNCTFPTLNQNTTGTAAGLTAQYIDWSASSGGASIANKPTLGALATAAYPSAGIPVSTGSAWGTSYTVGTSANNLVQLNSSAALPAVSGANLTGVNAATLGGATFAAPGAIGGTTPAAGTFTTLSAGASGFGVDADGDVTAKSLTITKQSSVAGDLGLYEANSTDTDAAGFRGPTFLTANTSYRGLFPTVRATSNNSVLVWSGTAGSGNGTPLSPYIHSMTWADLDNYLLLFGGTLTGTLITAASTTTAAGLRLPHGSAPTSPTNGDLWTTTGGLYARINGSTVGPFGTGGDALVDNTAYDASTWDGVEDKAPSKNAIRDYLETKIPAGADGTYGILLGNNTSSWTPGAGTYGYGFVAGVPTVDINNSQHALVATDTTQTFTNKTLDASATGNVLRQTGQMVFSRPAFIGSDTTQQTTATARVYGQTSFSGTAASTNNYAAYEAIIPWDFDADVALQAYFDFILSADQAEGARDHDYEVSYAVLSEGELGSKATSGGLTLTYSTMGAAYNSSGIVRRASSTSLTGWAAAWSDHKGDPVIIYVSRKGDTDNATAASYSKNLTIVYGSEQ